ncbi:MAG: hypothetical protein Q9216_005022, partial [Gyalolechia sp. 2 TL-2023]
MGVLVGTSLIVIIPEGVETLYSASETSHTHIKRYQPVQPLDIRWHHHQASPPFPKRDEVEPPPEHPYTMP